MRHQIGNSSFLTVLFSAFIDYAGIAIVYPLFAFMLFDPAFHFLPEGTSNAIRGAWLGFLIAIYSVLQLICAPIFGSLSDFRGRKKILLATISLGFLGYAAAILACFYESITLLAIYRVLAGIAAGNCSVVSAIVADQSTQENKAKNYGLLNMAFGSGFTIGPFLGGFFAHYLSITASFLIALLLMALNGVLVFCKLSETHQPKTKSSIAFFTFASQIKQAAMMPELRFLFLSLLLFSFGWSFFTEFASVFLIDRFSFGTEVVGLYYGYNGLFYAFSAGFLIEPILRRIKIEKTLFLSMLFSGLYLLIFLTIKSRMLIWLYLPFCQFFLSFVYPATSSIISDRVSSEKQGEALGIYQSVIALALAVPPLFGGPLVGSYPVLVIVVSSLFMLSAAAIRCVRRQNSHSQL
jgi:MFS transporter, DHA1 family, tetracycline resistance protein